MSYLKDFLNLIALHNYPALLRLWEEYCMSDEVDPEELKAILTHLKNSAFADAFGKHVEAILPLWDLLPESYGKHENFKLIIDLQVDNSEQLRERVILYLQNQFPDAQNFVDKMRIVGLRGQDKFQGAVASFELLNHMRKGKFVFHKGGWGVGEIMDVSALRAQLSIEFENVIEKKDLSFINCFQVLTPLPDHHFLALRFGNADKLEAQARNHPVEVVRMLLKDLGPKTAAEIKDELCDLVIPEKDWSKWWQNTRTKLRRDTMVEAPEDLKSPFMIRSSELSHEDRFRKLLEAKTDTPSLIQLIYSFLRDYPEILKNPDLKAFLISKVNEEASIDSLREGEALQLQFLLEDLLAKEGSEEASTLIQKSLSIEALLQSISILAFKKRALMAVKQERSDWKEIFLNLILTVGQNSLRDYIFAELMNPQTKHQLIEKLEELLKHAVRYPDVFVWYFQKVISDEEVPFATTEGKNLFFEAFFCVLHRVESLSHEKDLIKKMHLILSSNRYAAVRDIMKGSSLENAKEFLLLASKCHSLSDHDLKILHSLAEVVHPTLSKFRKDEEGEEEQMIIWTTESGMRKIQTRLQEIATHETVENAREIEVARSHGDLRENAEFKAALEKRDRLQTELKTLSQQVGQARILTESDILSDKVGIGAVVHCQNSSGKTLHYTILGPWDADAGLNILALHSKLAQTMKGLSVGDQFQFQGEEFKITKIESYLQK
ncbi:GreA/GreB family elongation factor [Rhabdochlamydiaceae symbiont of Dictyostelium giganteum]|uniref:GreA/GreB family elongation factor n=1 Tax=Rhabdochlamydiaceae symbiont of Dictyostelium giganteum TaxID=3342349 RepID=UPI00384F6D39